MKKNWLIVAVLALVVFLLGMLTNSIAERKLESKMVSKADMNFDQEIESRNELWGDFYPKEYQSWKQTKDTTYRGKYMSSDNDDLLAQRPEMVILWAGYAFSKDYTAPRGHMHAVDDVTETLRTGSPGVPDENTHSPQPGTCWTCKSPDVPRLMKEVGIENYYKAHFDDWGSEVVNPIGCANCHDPKTMNLTITQPALIEAFERQGKKISDATHQEMRDLVCAQCHVEYFFKGSEKYLTFPWDGGSTVEDIEKYYDNTDYADFIHKVSKTPILKAQHPDYEIHKMGIHGQRGVSCSDCHMPYKTEGGVKYTDHHIRSPLANINNTCQVCHRESEETLRENVYQRQDMVFGLRNRLEKQLAQDHFHAKFLWDNGATQEQMKDILQLIRKAQWRWDFITASHGAAFHAPIESQRVLADGLYYATQAESQMNKLIGDLKIEKPFVMPDISTKAKAQEIIGLDMEKEKANKHKFMKEVRPKWIEKAKQEGKLIVKN